MGSQTIHKLPIIDFSSKDLKTGTSFWVSTCQKVLEALEEYGCFEAVSLELGQSKAIDHSLKELFDLPLETKSKYNFDTPLLYGYISPSPSTPLLEGINIKDATNLEEFHYFTNLMWSSGNDKFSDVVYSYTKLMSGVEQMVKRMVFESLGVEKYYENHINSITYILRTIKYTDPKEIETSIGVPPHHDPSLITILSQNQVNGLEIQAKDGQWFELAPSASSFVVMAGLGFNAWSNGRIHAPIHRVVMRENKVRYSVGLFSYVKGNIETPEELVDEEHPLMFKPYDHLESVYTYVKKALALSQDPN